MSGAGQLRSLAKQVAHELDHQLEGDADAAVDQNLKFTDQNS